MATDFRALCAELLAWADVTAAHYVQLPDVMIRARAALAEPVAEQPSDDELGLIYHDFCRGCEFMDQVGFEDAARATLARWGQPHCGQPPAPPTEGEVAELVAKLRRLAPQNPLGSADPTITRAAELLKRHAAPVPAETLAARPLIEQVAAMGDCIGQQTVGQIVSLASRAASWLAENPPGQPVAIEPRGCPTPGACSCLEPAQAEPADALAAGAERPSDEELRDLWSWAAGQDQGPWPTQYHCFARAVLARWGQPLTPPADRHAAPVPVPVPVAERLPQPEDCDADGKCWLWNAPQFLGEAGWWTLNHYAWSEDPTHWLPAHALPVPAPHGGEVEP